MLFDLFSSISITYQITELRSSWVWPGSPGHLRVRRQRVPRWAWGPRSSRGGNGFGVKAGESKDKLLAACRAPDSLEETWTRAQLHHPLAGDLGKPADPRALALSSGNWEATGLPRMGTSILSDDACECCLKDLQEEGVDGVPCVLTVPLCGHHFVLKL